jgi:hydroxycarboxylate dehydrogenase B
MYAVAAPALTEFVTSVLGSVGVPRDDAAIVASSLVESNLRGHDSHGVMRLVQYIGFIERGEIRTGVALEVERETPAIVVCNGHWGLGQVQAHRLLELVLPKARALGVATGAARDCGHIGRLGEYAERAALQGFLLLATVNNCGAWARVAPPGGLEPRLGTNPFCAGIPTQDPAAPIVADFGTSVVAEGKVRSYYISRKPVPEGWLLDHEGRPTTDPAVLYEPPFGTILPLGGPQSYKGFGLGLILELWAGGLSGGRCSQPDVRSVGGNNVVFVVLDSAQFTTRESLTGKATQLAEYVRATPRISGVDAILLPGDPERITWQHRTRHGVTLDQNHWAKLAELATRFGVTLPEREAF